jgi:tetratricopeptide (TPR) repeat protein
VQWTPVKLETTHCPGDAVRLGPLSRAALALRDGAILRLDQNTTITFTPAAERAATWIELLTGAVHFWSRIPRGLRITTPFVNGSVEGTEFLIEVDAVETRLSVWEGQVLAENPHGSLTLAAGQGAAARAGQAPTPRPIVLRPADAVAWALYYPPVLDLGPDDFPDRPGETWPSLARRSLDEARRGDLAAALASASGIPDTVTDPRPFVHRAGLLLAVGRVDDAVPEIDRALRLAPGSGDALALRAVVAVTKGDRSNAQALADQAIQSDPRSAAAHLALSYARQSAFDLDAAIASAREAVRLQPRNALAQARLAELWLSLGNLDRAQEAAAEAVRLDPASARAQTVLGFAALTRIERREAAEAFERAIGLDPAAPLPRLGLGLTRIRGGDLSGGRQELEIAVGLDPGDSLLRSYLGKAYYEERRPTLAAEQFRLAQDLDPNDPTPWLYDAIRLQSVNRPVEALQSLERSIELNDNRAVYRSRLQLDEDRATRNVSLARIFDDLGFQQLALAEAWKSLGADPANYSAHRVLADSYSALPRHEIARVSEVLQSQLLQPLSVAPVPPQLGLSKPFFLAGTGPADPSFNEFNQLFERNRFSLWASGVVGGNSTFGDEIVVSALWDRISVSLGQLHYETDGFRANNDLRQDIYTFFGQVSLPTRTSLLLEARSSDRRNGDLQLRFDPDNFIDTQRQRERVDSIRLGLRQELTPASDLVFTLGYQTVDFDNNVTPDFALFTDEDSYSGEIQYLFRSRRVSLIAGGGHARVDRTDRFPNEPVTDATIDHTTLYLYTYLRLLREMVFTLGLSGDRSRGAIDDREQVNPKIGLTWTPFPSTTLRAALTRTLRRPLISSQTIEPTQVAGFSQIFDDPEGTDVWRYGVGADQRLSHNLRVGAELSRRDLSVPTLFLGPPASVDRGDESEVLGRAYIYWMPTSWMATGAEYQYERIKRDPEALNQEQLAETRIHRLPLSLSVFHPWGLTARVRATLVDQKGRFGDATGAVVSGDDQFVVLDASIAYRLPQRWGIVTLEARNLLDERFRFQDTDAANPTIAPGRVILLKLTLAY